MSRADHAQLLRLRRLREQRAWAERLRLLALRDAAQAQVHSRSAELRGLDAELAALAGRLAHTGSEVPRYAAYADARREDLAYRRERCEYDLIDDEEALAQAQRNFDDAAAQWRAARVRSDAAEQLLQRALRDARRMAELRLEREAPPHALAAPPQPILLATGRP